MQFTIEAASKRSKCSHEHATFHFGVKSGKVWLLSRDLTRSVGDHYKHIGQCFANEPKVVHIWSNDENAKLVSAFLSQRGYTVHGPTFHGDTQLNVFNPRKDGYSFRLTDPETIRWVLGLPSQKRRKSLGLGLVARGAEKAKIDVRDMHKAILARQGR